jgi:hypothetical protein
MTIVSSKEFKTNQDKYLDMALEEQVCIQKGNSMFFLIYKNMEEQNSEESSAKKTGSLTEGYGLWADDAPFDENSYRSKIWQPERNVW